MRAEQARRRAEMQEAEAATAGLEKELKSSSGPACAQRPRQLVDGTPPMLRAHTNYNLATENELRAAIKEDEQFYSQGAKLQEIMDDLGKI